MASVNAAKAEKIIRIAYGEIKGIGMILLSAECKGNGCKPINRSAGHQYAFLLIIMRSENLRDYPSSV